MDGFLKLYNKDDHYTHGIYKISLYDVANAFGYWKGSDCNMRLYQRTLHELTNEYLVENREFIAIKVVDDKI